MDTLKRTLRPLYVPLANLVYAQFRAPRRYRYLFETITEIKAVKILEVGTWTGDRAVQMITTAKRVSPSAQIEYYGFDLFEQMNDETFTAEISKRPPAEAEVQRRLEVTGATVKLFKGNTKTTLPEAIAQLPKIDFAYIDGGHHIDTISNDWECVSTLMHEGSVVIFDDYWRNRADHGCKTIIDALDRSRYDVNVLPIIDSFESEEFGRLDISFARVALRKA